MKPNRIPLYKYKCRFTGRPKGTLVKFSRFTLFVHALDADDALLKLYETHDDVREYTITEIQQ